MLKSSKSSRVRLDIDFALLLNRPNIFELGFHNFLLSVPSVQLEESQIDDAKNYIKGHLQGDVGTWTEREVKDKLKNWKLWRMEQDRPKPAYKPIDSDDPVEPDLRGGVSGAGEISQQKRSEAQAHIATISSLQEAQALLRQIANVCDEDILDAILNA